MCKYFLHGIGSFCITEYQSNQVSPQPMAQLAISAGAIGLTHLGEIYPVWVMRVSI
jgi:hypothetical protein